MRLRAQFKSLVSLAVVAGSLVLASCNAAPSSPGESSAETKASGHLTVGIRTLANNFDQSNSGTFATMTYPVMDILVYLDPEAQVIPGIAERWEISSDGKTHTFHIRKGVKFHDGSDLTGADVKFSMERILAADSIHMDTPAWRTAVASVELKDDYTVVVRVKTPQFELLPGFVTLTGSTAVYPKKYIEEKGWAEWLRHPVGSGPYKVVNWQPGSRLELEAVENHWRAASKVKNITVLPITEEATKVAMLKTGELDMAEVSVDSVAVLKAAGLRMVGHYGGTQWMFAPVWDTDRPNDHPFGDVRVRKAMSLAVNRQEVADKLASGYGKPATLSSVSRVSDYFDHNVKPDPFDPEGAKKLLAEAGYPSGFATKLWDTGGGDVTSNFFLALSGYWRKVGVNANLDPVDWGTFIRKVFLPVRPPEVVGTVWGTPGGAMGRGDFTADLSRFAMPAAMFRSPDPRLNELLKTVPTIANTTERSRLAREAALLAKEGYTRVAVVDVDILFAIGPKVGEVMLVPGNWGVAQFLDAITHAK